MLNDNQELAAEVLARHMAIVKYSSAPWDKLNDSERGRLMQDARFAIRVITPILADTPSVEIQPDEIPALKISLEEAMTDLYGDPATKCAEPQERVKCPCGKHIHPLYEKGYTAGAKTAGVTLNPGLENNPLYAAGYAAGSSEGRRDGALEVLRSVHMMLLDGNWSRKQQPGIELALEVVRQEKFISCGIKGES